MKAILIGAGRGQRLMPFTEGCPKSLVPLGGRRILDYALEAYEKAGVKEIVFIGGYQFDRVREAYPGLRYYHNKDWERNNILASLFHAEAEMDGPFICAYADILYRPSIIQGLLQAEGDAVVVCDTAWRERYRGRTQHPEHDAEKIEAENGLVRRIARDVPSERAHGEYIGVAKFSAKGAAALRDHYHRVVAETKGGPFRGAPSVQKAYKILLYPEMIEKGCPFGHHDTPGGYFEVDTTEDYELAKAMWL